MAWHYATNILPVHTEARFSSLGYWIFFEHDGNYASAIGPPDGNWYQVQVDKVWGNGGNSRGYLVDRGLTVYLDFGIRMKGSIQIEYYTRSFLNGINASGRVYASNNPDCWGDSDHASWTQIWDDTWDWYAGQNTPNWTWLDVSKAGPIYPGSAATIRYLKLTGITRPWAWDNDWCQFQSFRVSPDYVYSIEGLGALGPDSLVCDHEYGDTLYLGLHETDGKPIVMWVDWDFADYAVGYEASAGSSVGVQTAELRDTCIAYGQFGNNKQVIISEDKLSTWDEAQGEFGNDDVLTLEYHPTSKDDLVATRKVDQDYIQTLTQRAPWTDLGATPFVARSQLRVGSDIWIGSNTGGSSVVQLLSSGSGDWVDKSVGLPNVPINDLESA